jgi:NADPH-dependent 2,4-dienoyl-CoA reductase/sulfur reductase-like enzyme
MSTHYNSHIFSFDQLVRNFVHGLHRYLLRKAELYMGETRKVDVVVIGGGIAGTAISWSLQEQKKLQVAVVDPRFNGQGTW